MIQFKTEILGQEWTVCLCGEEEDSRLKDTMGFTDWTSRKIVVGRIPDAETNLDYPIAILCKVLRHEMVHAFLFSSGLGDDFAHPAMGHDETMTDWIAYHLHRIASACADAEHRLVTMILEEKHDRAGTD